VIHTAGFKEAKAINPEIIIPVERFLNAPHEADAWCGHGKLLGNSKGKPRPSSWGTDLPTSHTMYMLKSSYILHNARAPSTL